MRKKLEHYDQIVSMESGVSLAITQFEACKAAAKEAKGNLERKLFALRKVIAEGTDPQREFAFGGDDDAPAGGPAMKPMPAAADDKSADAPRDDWRQRPVSVLAIPAKLAEKLELAGVATLGQLADRWKRNEPLADIKGIGQTTADKVADAWAEYAKANQELYGDEFKQQDPAPATPPPADPNAPPADDPFGGADEAAGDENDDDPSWEVDEGDADPAEDEPFGDGFEDDDSDD